MGDNLANRVQSVKSILLKNHTIKVKTDWLNQCVEFFIHSAPNIDDEILYKQSFEQYILADAKEASNPVIPASILQKKEPFTLYGTFCLQMQFLIEICE
jgi:RecQ-mediated genome instability protein 1